MNRRNGHNARSNRAKQGHNPDQSHQPGSFRLGKRRYEVLERLSLPDRGRWLVRDPRPHPRGTRYVAIVLPNNEATAQLRRSLLRLPKHANSLPSLIDHGRIGDRYCLIVDWWQGLDFREYLKRVHAQRTVRPSPTECLRLFRGLAHSLRLLHDVAQVIHGDLKPANLVLTVKPSSLRLIDFGSSWQLERTRRRLPGDGSDPTYRAPELFQPDSFVDHASDQFSLGVILYQALTLQIPYDGLGGKVGHEDFRAEFRDDGSDLVPPSELIEAPQRIPRSILAETDALLSRLLRIAPEDRFPNPRACATAFDKLAARIQVEQHAEPAALPSPNPINEFFSRVQRLFSNGGKE